MNNKRRVNIAIVYDKVQLIDSDTHAIVKSFTVSTDLADRVLLYIEEHNLLPSAQAFEAFPNLHLKYKGIK